jgi:hypothetical protein
MSSNATPTESYKMHTIKLLFILPSFQVVIFTALLAASNAAPGYDSSSFSHYGPVTATVHAPSLGYSHPPVVTAHAPVEIENHVSCSNKRFSCGY